MAPDPKTTEPANEQWLQLRRKHDADLQEFQLRVQEANARFLQNVERERKEILDGHAEEEKAFWSKPNNVKKPTPKKTSAKSQGNSTVAASTAKIGRGANQTPGSNPRVTQNPKNAAATPKSSRTTSQLSPGTTTATASSSRPASKKAAVAYIDLCSDDDKPVVLQKTIQSPAADSYQEKPRSIPTATLELFGKNVKPSTVSCRLLHPTCTMLTFLGHARICAVQTRTKCIHSAAIGSCHITNYTTQARGCHLESALPQFKHRSASTECRFPDPAKQFFGW